MDTKFAAGDVVILKSDKLLVMTVDSINEQGQVVCVWLSPVDWQFYQMAFNPVTLKLDEPTDDAEEDARDSEEGI